MTLQLAVEIFGALVDFLIVIFFFIELRTSAEDRIIQAKQIAVLEELNKLLTSKAEQEIEILEDVHAEISELNDKAPEIPEEEQSVRE